MSTDSRKAQLEVGADASGVVRALDTIGSTAQDNATKVEQAGERMSAGFNDLPKASDAASKKVERDTSTIVASIQRATAAANAGGRGTAEYYSQLASSKGIDAAQVAPYLAELAKAQASTKALGAAAQGVSAPLKDGAMSAAALAAATRSLPAQFTDIVTSLQGGQKPLTVLFQQGGQIKDMFGGVGNAVSATGRYVLGLLNPLTLSAAGVAALAYAFQQGSKEEEAFNRTLILSGSAAGVTTSQLQKSAAAIRDMGAATQGRAAEVLNAMAQSAGIGAQNTERFAAAALQLERAGGPAAEATVKAFKDLAKAPLEAALALNEQYNFLTPAVYQQIRALEDQGKATQAAQVAQEAYFAAINGRVPQLEQNLGTLERAWRSVGEGAKSAWDWMLGIGRSTTPEQQIDTLQARVTALQANISNGLDAKGNPFGGSQAREDAQYQLTALIAQLAVQKSKVEGSKQEAENSATTLEATKALAALDAQSDQYLPRRLQMEKELAQVRENAAKALAAPNLDDKTRTTIQTNERNAEKGIREKYDPGLDQVQAQNDLATLQRQLGLITDAYANAERVLEVQRAAGLVSDREYYASKAALIEVDRQNTIASLQAEINLTTAANNSDKLTTAQHQANVQKVLDLQASISKANSKAATDTVLLSQVQTSALTKVADAYTQALDAAQDYLNALRLGESRDLAGLTSGSAEQQRQQAIDQISDQYANERRRLQRQRAALPVDDTGNIIDQTTKNSIDRQLALQDAFEKASLTSYNDYTQKKLAADADWTTGATKAWNDWSDEVSNVAKQTNDLFKGMFDDLTTDLQNFVKTGHLSFSSFGEDAVSQIEKSGIQYALQQAFKYLKSTNGDTGGTDFGGFLTTIGSLLYSAQGNVFSPGSQLEAYRNSVVTSPTVFKFATGYAPNVGVMGEKSNSPGEAIMPLIRTRSGDLGVQAVGQQSQRQTIVNQTFVVPGAVDRRTQSQLAIANGAAVQRAARRA